MFMCVCLWLRARECVCNMSVCVCMCEAGLSKQVQAVAEIILCLSLARMLMWPRHNRVQITCNTSGAFRVQHVVCYVVRRDRAGIDLFSDLFKF